MLLADHLGHLKLQVSALYTHNEECWWLKFMRSDWAVKGRQSHTLPSIQKVAGAKSQKTKHPLLLNLNHSPGTIMLQNLHPISRTF
jgi:hypothetical protein